MASGRGASAKSFGEENTATQDGPSGIQREKKKGGQSSTPAARGRDGVGEGSTVYMTSTEAQNGFGRVLDTVARNNTVLITKRNATQAVVMSVDRYEALTRGASSELDTLTAEFNDLLSRMQTPQAKAGLHDAFWASPDELARAAVVAARATE